MSTGTAAADAPAAGHRTTPYAWVVLGMLAFIYIFNFLDRQLMSTLIESIKKDTGFTDKQMGFMTGFNFALFYTVFGVIVGFLADRTSRRNILFAGAFLWSAFTALCGMAQNYPVMLAARAGVGIGEAAGAPPSYSIISDYFPPEKRGLALALFSLGVPLGLLLRQLCGELVGCNPRLANLSNTRKLPQPLTALRGALKRKPRLLGGPGPRNLSLLVEALRFHRAVRMSWRCSTFPRLPVLRSQRFLCPAPDSLGLLYQAADFLGHLGCVGRRGGGDGCRCLPRHARFLCLDACQGCRALRLGLLPDFEHPVRACGLPLGFLPCLGISCLARRFLLLLGLGTVGIPGKFFHHYISFALSLCRPDKQKRRGDQNDRAAHDGTTEHFLPPRRDPRAQSATSLSPAMNALRTVGSAMLSSFAAEKRELCRMAAKNSGSRPRPAGRSR
ncbi:MAG: MFS transporter [Rhodospirillales bacterium]|nr:MFS transporter [Rhodospirillales bacterium]